MSIKSKLGSLLISISPTELKKRTKRAAILSISIFLLILTSFLAAPLAHQRANAYPAETATPLVTGKQDLAKQSPVPTQPASPTPTKQVSQEYRSISLQDPLNQGTVFLSLSDGGFSHLYVYQPVSMPLTPISSGPWDDITPAVSPDGTRLAFASNREGFWDIYILNLKDGQTTRFTNTSAYDAFPSWSPDGSYLVYESYLSDLEIIVQAVESGSSPILLSENPAADFSPSWSPQGRQIAFVSDRDGSRDIWIADLDKTEDSRFTNISQNAQEIESHPTWSNDGGQLAWAGQSNGIHSIYVWEKKEARSRLIGSGDWPQWSPDGSMVLTSLEEPNLTMLTALSVQDGLLRLPPVKQSGRLTGLSWGEFDQIPQIFSLLPGAEHNNLNDLDPEKSAASNNNKPLRSLKNVQAPYPELHREVIESFSALRNQTTALIGWDFLSTLENAFVPLTSPLDPSLGDDWLYSGRAFCFDLASLSAGWAMIIPENFDSAVYWRVYLRTRYQDGSQGRPVTDLPWDLYARIGGDPLNYENGGRFSPEVPSGYWVDFTALARDFGWERLPSLSNWQSAFFAARFNEFVQTSNLTWRDAMLELYPPEALITPMPLLPPTLTPVPTSRWYHPATPHP